MPSRRRWRPRSALLRAVSHTGRALVLAAELREELDAIAQAMEAKIGLAATDDERGPLREKNRTVRDHILALDVIIMELHISLGGFERAP